MTAKINIKKVIRIQSLFNYLKVLQRRPLYKWVQIEKKNWMSKTTAATTHTCLLQTIFNSCNKHAYCFVCCFTIYFLCYFVDGLSFQSLKRMYANFWLFINFFTLFLLSLYPLGNFLLAYGKILDIFELSSIQWSCGGCGVLGQLPQVINI